MDYDVLKFWWIVVIQVIEGGILIAIWWGNRNRATRQEFGKVREEFEGGLRSVRVELRQFEAEYRNGLNRLEKHFDERLDALADRRSGDIARLSAVEKHLDHLPTQADIAALRNDVADVREAVSEVRGALKGIDNLTHVINQFLLSKGGAS